MEQPKRKRDAAWWPTLLRAVEAYGDELLDGDDRKRTLTIEVGEGVIVEPVVVQADLQSRR